MYRKYCLSVALTIVVVLTGCSGDQIVDDDHRPTAVTGDSDGRVAVEQLLTQFEDEAKAEQGKRPNLIISRSRVYPFMAAGDVGGGVLEPGTVFPPTGFSGSLLLRGHNGIRALVVTSGLPAGAYTMWWVVFNHSESCTTPSPDIGIACGEPDLFEPDVAASVFWATGGVVKSNGLGVFRSRTFVGANLGTPGEQLVLGTGLTDVWGSEVHLIIKYHGPASEDPEILRDQTTTILGSCFEGANAVDLGEPFGVHCFDPQFAAHSP